MTALIIVGLAAIVLVCWFLDEKEHAPVECHICQVLVPDDQWEAHKASHAEDRWVTQHPRGTA